MTDALLKLLIRTSFYPSLWVNRLMCAAGLWRQADWVDDHVAIGSLPSAGELRRFAEQGVGAVVNLCEEYAGDDAALASCGLRQLRLPTLDYHCPSREHLLRGVAFMKDEIAAGRKVLVHCKAGRGRSAILVLCYLMVSRRIRAADALAILRAARPRLARGIERYEIVRQIERMALEALDD